MAQKAERQRGKRGQGSVYKRAEPRKNNPDFVRWTASYKGITRYADPNTESAAWALLDKIKVEYATGEVLTAKENRTVSMLIDTWLEEVVAPARAYRTHLEYEKKARVHIKPYIGKVKLSDLEPLHVQRMLNYLGAEKPKGAGLSRSYVAGVKSVLSAVLKQGVRWRWISYNPASAELVDVPKCQPGRPKQTFTEDTAMKLTQVLMGHEYGSFFIVMFLCGLRRGEVAGLTRGSIEYDPKTHRPIRLHITRQLQYQTHEGDDGRTPYLVPVKTISSAAPVILPRLAQDALIRADERTRRIMAEKASPRQNTGPMTNEQARVRRNWAIQSELVFVNRSGCPLCLDTMGRHLEAICEEAGVQRMTQHSLRALFITTLLRGTLDIKTVSEAARHSRPQMTLEYAKKVHGSDQQVADALNAVLGG